MNTLESTCKMNILDTACEMNTLDTTCEMNTLDTACEMKTLNTTCEMSTVDTHKSCEMNTMETVDDESSNTVVMNTVDTSCEMNTVEISTELNAMENMWEMSSSETICQMKTLKTIANESNSKATLNNLETVGEVKTNQKDQNSAEIINTFETVVGETTTKSICSVKEAMKTESLEGEPVCKKARLESSELVKDSLQMLSQSDDSLKETACEMKTLKKVVTESNKKEALNTLETVGEVDTNETVANDRNSSNIINTVKTVVGETATKSVCPVKDTTETSAESICSVMEAVKTVASESSGDEPVCKKARLESSELVKDSFHILPQSNHSLEGPKKDAVSKSEHETSPDDNNHICDVSEHNPCEETTVYKKDQIGAAEKLSPLTEIQAGITEYLGSHKGFSAVIKQRYSDFIVNEIDIQGNVVCLTQMESPESFDEGPKEECSQDNDITSDIISDDDIAKLENLLKSSDKKASVNIVAPADKEARTKIHLAVKKKYIQLETKTTEVDGQKMIQVVWKTGKSRERGKVDWPESKKDCKYVKFVLYKENKDTMDAIGLIAKNLKVKEGLFQYAGTKDKRAKTSQEITANRIHPKKLSFLNKVLWNMGLGNFQYVKEPLKLGQLSGNQFTIVLRNVQGNNETVDSAMSSLKTSGFVNYYGMQRFGTTLVPTHKVGCALLHSDWEKAVDLILMPRNDNPSKDAFQKVWMDTHDPEATLKVTPGYCGLERNLLEALKRKMKPFNALEKISRNTRLLYIHSYQALIWNQMVSKRLKVFGSKPVVGDLAFVDNADSSERSTPVLITPDNLNQFTIHQVVLPLPGHDVIYPKNEVHTWYRDTMAADGVDIDNMKRPQKDYSLPGAYRHITVCPSSVAWSHHRYDDYSLSLTQSDMDIIKGDKLPTAQNKGKFKAVVLKMTLPASCYATMALREVLRVDTSVAHQTSLNVT